MPQPKTSQRSLKRHTLRPLLRGRRMIELPTIPIEISLNPASGRTAPIQLLRRPQRTAQVVGEGFGFDVVVVSDVGVVDRDAGTVGTGPGG